MSKGTDVTDIDARSRLWGHTPLALVSKEGHYDITPFLIAHKVDINVVRLDGRNPCKKGYLQVLLDSGICVDARNNVSCTALIIASYCVASSPGSPEGVGDDARYRGTLRFSDSCCLV